VFPATTCKKLGERTATKLKIKIKKIKLKKKIKWIKNSKLLPLKENKYLIIQIYHQKIKKIGDETRQFIHET
jgi:hypothetical protein